MKMKTLLAMQLILGEEWMPKKRIMIIDDDVVFTEELKDILASSGYEIYVENDPRCVHASIRHANPEVVLLDINMPKKSGFDVANELRYGESEFTVPIIIMTGYYKPAFDQAFKMLGIEKCLHKPFSPTELISIIESA
jgi:DNA-binding response OmpR family regulator